jgi:hypothetical protein
MTILALLFATLAAAGESDVHVRFSVWSWKQHTVEERARAKLGEAARAAGYRDIAEVNTSRVCSFLYCNVKADARGVR